MLNKIYYSIALFLLGCFDLTFDDHPHLVTDLEILAIHVDPPEIQWSTPLDATILYSDPNGDNQLIQSAWRIRYYRQIDDSFPVADLVVTQTDHRVPTIRLSPPSLLRATQKGDAPAIRLDVFLCSGEINKTLTIQSETTETLLSTLCSGTIAAGVKGVRSPIPIGTMESLDSASSSPIDILFEQQNPRITQLEIDGIVVPSLEEGGIPYTLCTNVRDCDQQTFVLQATLDSQSLDAIMLLPKDHTGTAIEYRESHRIDWYVTQGVVTPPSSYPSSFTTPITAQNQANLFQTTWQIPKQNENRTITLYVVARDERGGNDWRTYQFYWGAPL